MRNGTPAKIMDFDFNGEIAYKFKDIEGKDYMATCLPTGKHETLDGSESQYDLFMEPVCGYMLIIANSENTAYGLRLHTTLEDAKKEAESLTFDKYSRFLAYAKVELLDEEEDEQ